MRIVVYTKTGCPWCIGVTNMLRASDIEFEEKEVTGNKKYFEEMVAKSGQSKAPVADMDGEILADTDAEAVAEFLKNKGRFKLK